MLGLSKGLKMNECLPWIESKKKKVLNLEFHSMLRGHCILNGGEINKGGLRVAEEETE